MINLFAFNAFIAYGGWVPRKLESWLGALKNKLHEHALYAEQTTYKHVQWHRHRPFETTAEPVIAKGPEVMLDTVTQQYRLADHAEYSQKLRLRQTLRILAPRH